MWRNLFEGWHLVILILVIVVVFGWKRLPDAARSLGRSARILKSEVDEMKSESASSKASKQTVNGETVKDETVQESEQRLNDQTAQSAHDVQTPRQPQAGHPDGFPQRNQTDSGR